MSPSITLLLCLIVGITDGDTLTARCADQTLRVRIAEIDAPEKKQAWGQASKQALSDLCFNINAEIQPVSRDRYGRQVARVRCNDIDVSENQVAHGLAWVYDKYATDVSLYSLQGDAQRQRQGLWSDDNPVAPWLWRKQR